MHPQLSVSAVSSWQWTLDEDLAFWARAGIEHVGLSFRKLEEAGVERAVERIAAAGLRVSNVVELGWWDLADPGTWPQQQQRLAVAIDVAAVLGGCLVLTTGPARGMEWDDAATRFSDAVAPVRGAAAAAGVSVTVEHTGPLRLDLSFCTSFTDGVDLARRAGVGLCMEVSSCFAERDLSRSIAGAGDVLGHVQLSDFVIGSLSTPDRAVPGDGDIPLARIVEQVVAAGYEGPFELELVGPRIEREGYAAAIGRGVTALDALLVQPRA
ncbi:MAG TPA: sugar phosphate isomerase/epimerase [Acidimicrobiia bacterium]